MARSETHDRQGRNREGPSSVVAIRRTRVCELCARHFALCRHVVTRQRMEATVPCTFVVRPTVRRVSEKESGMTSKGGHRSVSGSYHRQ